jgi:hypothetical protein
VTIDSIELRPSQEGPQTIASGNAIKFDPGQALKIIYGWRHQHPVGRKSRRVNRLGRKRILGAPRFSPYRTLALCNLFLPIRSQYAKSESSAKKAPGSLISSHSATYDRRHHLGTQIA